MKNYNYKSTGEIMDLEKNNIPQLDWRSYFSLRNDSDLVAIYQDLNQEGDSATLNESNIERMIRELNVLERVIKKQFLNCPYKKFTYNAIKISDLIDWNHKKKKIVLKKLIDEGFIQKINKNYWISYVKAGIEGFNIDKFLSEYI